MKSKYFIIKVAGILFFMLVSVLYFILYFMPTVKSISKYKRDVKDINLKISDFVKAENAFTFSNRLERSYFMQSDIDLKKGIGVIRSREDFIQLFTNIAGKIRSTAQRDGLTALVLTSQSKDLNVNAGNMNSDKKTLDQLLEFSISRLKALEREDLLARQNLSLRGVTAKAIPVLAGLVKDARFHTLWLSFTGPLKSAMNFINHLSWSGFYLGIEKVIVAKGDIFPNYIVQVKIYYIDLRTTGRNGR